jgi:myo-inositol-1(or 4)-monophosphatase
VTPVPESELLDVAKEAAAAAGAELQRRFGGDARGVRSKSSPTDLVSAADLAAEAAVKDVITRRRPHDGMLAEESGESGDGELRWVVDPLDGTINFLFGVPAFAVSVACEDASGTIVGVVLDPVRGECFSATRGERPCLDGEPIHAPSGGVLGEALVATGFGYEAPVRARQAQVLTRVLPRVRDIRRAGAAALDLCWCACGRYDAYYERGVKPWDIAAGVLIAERAGLVTRELAADGEDEPFGIVVAPAEIIDELYSLVVGASALD